MRILVSKNGLPFIRLCAVELEAWRQRPRQTPQRLDGILFSAGSSGLKFPPAGYADFDVIALFEVESFDNGGREADCQTVAPFENLHNYTISRLVYPSCALGT
jgi:hypothetical protein